MPRSTWGSGAEPISREDLENAQGSRFKRYDGPTVPDGIYAFKINQLRKGKSQNGNDQLIIGLELVPRKGRPEQVQYKGFYVTDYIPVMSSTADRLKPFLDAIGVSVGDFMDRMMDDGQANRQGSKGIQKFGKWVFESGKVFVLAEVETGSYKGKSRREIAYGGYWAPTEAAAAVEPTTDDDADASGAVDDEPPF